MAKIRSTFSHIRGFSSIEEAKEVALRCFPNISWEEYLVLEAEGEYYAVTMHSYDFEIVISKEYIRYCERAYKTKTCKTNEFGSSLVFHPGFNNGKSRWDSSIIYRYRNSGLETRLSEHTFSLPFDELVSWLNDCKSVIKKVNIVFRGEKVKGRIVTENNATILLLLLFCDQTRFRDVRYKSYWDVDFVDDKTAVCEPQDVKNEKFVPASAPYITHVSDIDIPF